LRSRLGEVSTPTLVMMGDDDIPSVEHADDIHNGLADAQLAIVPGTSHALPMGKPDLVNRLILDFLADSQTAKMF
jgi:pimeloyl-ACP methyl ester carboxylesterase